MKPYEIIKEDLSWDGSWRDFYIVGTDHSDWDRFLESITEGPFKYKFTHGGFSMSMPRRFAEIEVLRRKDPVLFQIFVGEIQLNCHFFCDKEIELDLDPRQCQSEGDWLKLVDFLQFVVRAVNKNGILTLENQIECVIEEFNVA